MSNPSDSLREQFIQLHAQYISDHVTALDRLKPSVVRQYKLEAEISKIPTKFCEDVMELFKAHSLQEQREGVELARDVVDWSTEAYEQLSRLLDGEIINGYELPKENLHYGK